MVAESGPSGARAPCGGGRDDERGWWLRNRDPAGPGHLVGAAGMMRGGGVVGWEGLVGRSD